MKPKTKIIVLSISIILAAAGGLALLFIFSPIFRSGMAKPEIKQSFVGQVIQTTENPPSFLVKPQIWLDPVRQSGFGSAETWSVKPKSSTGFNNCYQTKETKLKKLSPSSFNRADCRDVIKVGQTILINYGDVDANNKIAFAAALAGLRSTDSFIVPSPTPGENPTPSADGQIPTPSADGRTSGKNPFGVMPGAPGMTSKAKAEVALNLGTTYIRGADIKVDKYSGSCPDCDAALNAGLKLILTVRNGGGRGTPSFPPSDIAAYKATLEKVMQKYRPEVLVVENEENSGKLFYSGTPAQYHDELSAACSVSHRLGVKCANGGLVSSLTALLVIDDYLKNGQAAAAEDYFNRTIAGKFGGQSFTAAVNSQEAKSQITKGKELLSGYKSAGADFINFHWYIADVQALGTAKEYLEKASGLPAMTNEIGQQKNESPVQVTSIMQEIINLKLPYAVWYSIDTPGFGEARALTESDGSLRPNGEAFEKFIADNFGP